MPYRKVKLSPLQAREAEVSNLSLELLELEDDEADSKVEKKTIKLPKHNKLNFTFAGI